MQREIISARDESRSDWRPAEKLDDRLDSAIGETSSSMGALLSELIRRSLKTGVSDIGDSLAEHASEQVDQAVQSHMPTIAEAADAVAESTSRRIVGRAVEDWNEKSNEQQRGLESRIDALKETTVQRTLLQQLRLKARQRWKKLRAELASLEATQHKLHNENDLLKKELLELRQHTAQQEVEIQRLRSAMLEQHQRSENRLAELERPKGIRGLLHRFRHRDQNQSAIPADETDPEES